MSYDILNVFGRIVQCSDHPLTVFELGACNGDNTHQMVDILDRLCMPYRYFAFEPVAYLANHVTDVFRRYSNVTVINAAIGAREGVADFHVSNSKYYGSSSLRRPTPALYKAWPDMKFNMTKVEVVTLDGFCAKYGINEIDFIWSDIQGAEGDLIDGGRHILSRTYALYTECDGGLYEGDIRETELLAKLPGWVNAGRDAAGNMLLFNGDCP